jgi:predicted flap endonuclease-1-like 5' DNA nuclease
MTSYVWKGKIYTSLTKAPEAMIAALSERGLLPGSGDTAAGNGPDRHHDDLTILDKLGPARAEDLNERGIYTFQDLADADLDVLEAIDGVSRTTAVAWIAEAQSILEGAE